MCQTDYVPLELCMATMGEAPVHNDLSFGDIKGEYIIVRETVEDFHPN
jgi:hypothetical protein